MRRRPAMWRSADRYVCQFCGNLWHPIYTSARLYCSPKCSGRANSRRQAVMRQVKADAAAGRLTADQIAAFMSAPPPQPVRWDHSTEDAS